MPLRVKIQAEPFTEYSKGVEPILATSEEYDRLYRDLERYTNGQIQGRSYLIAGHRGSGKTLLVHKAIEDLIRKSLDKPYRPLFVRLHGPDLLRLESGKAPKEAKEAQKEPGPAKPTVADPTKEAAADKPPQLPVEGAKADLEMVNVLTEMVKALARDVTNEYRRCYREAALRAPFGLKREQLLEIASQFDLELMESSTPSRLRNYWHRIDAFRQGILFTGDRSRYQLYTPPGSSANFLSATDVGLQEILVLSFLSQAFQVISGKTEETQKQTDAAKNERSAKFDTAYELKNLLAPVAGLLTGGAVGVGLSATNSVAAVLLGLLTGAIVSFSFSYSSSRSQSRETRLESVFIKDRSVPTLSSVVPQLVMRLKQIGLAPVFVIDELDKVHDLKVRMQTLVRQLKFLVTENSFSCFLTDRRYLTYLDRQSNQTAYAPEYTYFSNRLLVLYSPAELRMFVKNVLEYVPPDSSSSQEATESAGQPDQQEEEAEKLAYVVMHRSRLHPIDLRREIDRLPANTTFAFSTLFPLAQYRFEILMQLAIEWLLKREDVQSQLRKDPDSRQVIYDALYYLSRLWEDASDTQKLSGFKQVEKKPGEKKPGFELDKKLFAKYLESRCAEEAQPGQSGDFVTGREGDETEQSKGLGGLDFDFLFEKVSDLVSMLAQPEQFAAALRNSTDRPPQFILNALQTQQLFEKITGTNKYLWRYDFSGRYLETREVETVLRDVDKGITSITEINISILTVSAEVSLQTMMNLRIIPSTPGWSAVLLAGERLRRLASDLKPYGEINADRDCIVEFEVTLSNYERNVRAALLCAAIFAPEIRGNTAGAGSAAEPTTGARLLASLVQTAQLLQLSASPEDDLRKLNAVLASPLIRLEVTSENDWNEVLNFVKPFIEKNEPRDPGPIIEAAWTSFKNRFTRRFRDGVTLFDPQFEDLFTSIRDIGPGRNLSFDLSTMTAAQWTSFLAKSLAEQPDITQVPWWLRVPAALELGLFDLAERFLNPLGPDPLFAQWVRDARLRVALQTSTRRNVLVLGLEHGSLTANWKPSMRHSSLVSNVLEFRGLLAGLKTHEISKPGDFPIDVVFVELSGDRGVLGKLVTQKPSNSLAEISSSEAGLAIKEIDLFLNVTDIYYLVKEAPLLPSAGSPMRFSVAPKGIDDLIEHLPAAPVSPPPPAS